MYETNQRDISEFAWEGILFRNAAIALLREYKKSACFYSKRRRVSMLSGRIRHSKGSAFGVYLQRDVTWILAVPVLPA
jgi:hypothetical protein